MVETEVRISNPTVVQAIDKIDKNIRKERGITAFYKDTNKTAGNLTQNRLLRVVSTNNANTYKTKTLT